MKIRLNERGYLKCVEDVDGDDIDHYSSGPHEGKERTVEGKNVYYYPGSGKVSCVGRNNINYRIEDHRAKDIEKIEVKDPEIEIYVNGMGPSDMPHLFEFEEDQ